MLNLPVNGKTQGLFKAFECFSRTFQGLFKTVLYNQLLFKLVRTLIYHCLSFICQLDRLKQTSSSQQTGGSGETTTGLVTELRETIQSLTTQLQGLEDKMNSQLVAVRNEIEEMKKENRRSAAYPWQ